jgi:hypothetical protein
MLVFLGWLGQKLAIDFFGGKQATHDVQIWQPRRQQKENSTCARLTQNSKTRPVVWAQLVNNACA